MPQEATDATPPWALGRAIAQRRAELGLSRNDLVERSGLSYPYVAELEKGQKRPSTTTIGRLAEALELTGSELFERAEVIADEAHGRGTVSTSSWFHETSRRRSVAALAVPAASALAPPPMAAAPMVVADAAPGPPESLEEMVRRIVREELREAGVEPGRGKGTKRRRGER